jgi:hypothetical protein
MEINNKEASSRRPGGAAIHTHTHTHTHRVKGKQDKYQSSHIYSVDKKVRSSVCLPG